MYVHHPTQWLEPLASRQTASVTSPFRRLCALGWTEMFVSIHKTTWHTLTDFSSAAAAAISTYRLIPTSPSYASAAENETASSIRT